MRNNNLLWYTKCLEFVKNISKCSCADVYELSFLPLTVDVLDIVLWRCQQSYCLTAGQLALVAACDAWTNEILDIGIFESPKCDVNPQPNTRGIGPLVGRTSGNRRSVMHVLAVIFSITYHFFFICQYIFIQVILSGRGIYPLLMYPTTFLVF